MHIRMQRKVPFLQQQKSLPTSKIFLIKVVRWALFYEAKPEIEAVLGSLGSFEFNNLLYLLQLFWVINFGLENKTFKNDVVNMYVISFLNFLLAYCIALIYITHRMTYIE